MINCLLQELFFFWHQKYTRAFHKHTPFNISLLHAAQSIATDDLWTPSYKAM